MQHLPRKRRGAGVQVLAGQWFVKTDCPSCLHLSARHTYPAGRHGQVAPPRGPGKPQLQLPIVV
jgi:hypothetical protein